MAKSTVVDINKPKKRRPGRPVTGIGPIIAVRLYPHQLAELDEWIHQQPKKMSRPAAIRDRLMVGIADAKLRDARAGKRRKK
jgi:hypothetical protein